MSSAVGAGIWLRMGGGVAATGCFFAAQPARSKQNTNAVFLMPSVFALGRPLVDCNLGYSPFADTLAKVGTWSTAQYSMAGRAGGDPQNPGQ
jgi:hypothetical protein